MSFYQKEIVSAYNYTCDNYYFSENIFCNQIERQADTAASNGILRDEYFKGLDLGFQGMIRGIELYCAYKGDDVKAKIDAKSGIIVDCAKMVSEFDEADRTEWAFDEFSFIDDSITKKTNNRIPYDKLLSLRQVTASLYQKITTANEGKQPPKPDETPQRVIDVERLKVYFTAPFKGLGNGNINFFDMMIEELKMERSSKDFARIALMIYYSKKMNHNKPSTFAKWYCIFCDCVGCDKKKYKPEHLTPTDSLIKVFGYL